VTIQNQKVSGYLGYWSGRRELNPRPKRWQRVPLFHSIVFQRLFLVKCA